ncbi:hypothetical protein XH99_10335 [Bradyrhizobium nanningense]|uniref:Uncharacterized protein n=1 Tax=Bradyrhizobium nanningense TaxID=1325118 RepID=A0A4Q0S7A2_9BRAD|nr:hypothetical protein [Bradyrhizobium nanningense]RXH25523.1 hypothetical protein XH84_31285 [Bradyrhizobium nanningense]RXH31922.1 hypothetical protein XH99_10335 [Bradyrhizobium nanningense]TQF30307.1 hypothetical protein UNPA324_12340 [Bradyrhizobium sp. UNPA324]
MSEILQKLLQARAEPSPEAKWPQWIVDVIAYRPESPAPVVGSPTKAVPLEADERRNIRVLSRVSSK